MRHENIFVGKNGFNPHFEEPSPQESRAKPQRGFLNYQGAKKLNFAIAIAKSKVSKQRSRSRRSLFLMCFFSKQRSRSQMRSRSRSRDRDRSPILDLICFCSDPIRKIRGNPGILHYLRNPGIRGWRKGFRLARLPALPFYWGFRGRTINFKIFLFFSKKFEKFCIGYPK